MKIVVSGGSGFIGQPLVRHLQERGHEVAVLTRNPEKVKAGRPLLWDGRTQGAWSAEAAAADAIVNLAGENVGERRWTEKRKRELIDSRIHATTALVEAVRSAWGAGDLARARGRGRPRPTFISASGVSFYASGLEEPLDENGPRGEGVLADMSARWEEAARGAESVSRLVIFRLGVVIGPGGALAKMYLPFKLGLGGRIASGKQWLSWIAREDVIGLIEWALMHDDVSGVYNGTSPHPVRNREFTTAVARALHRPAIIPIPAFALKILFGRMAEETLLTGQRAVPDRAMKNGFRFTLPAIESATLHALRRR